jgi:uncharacterized protein (DUF1697 family)
MPRLRAVFEGLGLEEVSTYINTGNVIYAGGEPTPGEIEDALEREFGWRIRVLVRTREAIDRTVTAIPGEWRTDATMRCDVLFIPDTLNHPSVLGDLPAKPGVDSLLYVDGAVIWQVDAVDLNRSGRTRIIGGHLYKESTVRNANTVRKLAELMKG